MDVKTTLCAYCVNRQIYKVIFFELYCGFIIMIKIAFSRGKKLKEKKGALMEDIVRRRNFFGT